jgi:regulator of replication initiation timing
MKLFDMMTSEDMERLNAENKKLKKRAEEAEGENTIIKGIGQNSPEMRTAQARIKELENNRPLSTMDEIAYRELENRVKELEGKCREAGRAMIELNMKYESNIKELDRLSEENTNLKVMLKGTDGEDSSNNS